jgi:arylsulfatase A-like enzyme
MPPMTRREMLRQSGLGAAAMLAAAPAIRAETPPPNIVWIWCDNLAYGDPSCYGNTRIETPVMDAVAAAGARFSQYYIAHTVCSPSRAALLTGRQPWRAGVIDVLRPDSPGGLPADEITLGQALRDCGYATCCIGKWHLGDRREYLPLQRGFDSYFGMPYSMDMLPPVIYRNNEIADRVPGDRVRNITERYVDEAIGFVRQHREKPFFLYFNHTIPHPPLNIPEARRKAGHTVYEDAVEYMDAETGRLLDAIREAGLEENTLVCFTSDNGPMGEHGDTAGLRGRIRDAYEGGIRVPLVVRWPNRIPPGTVIDTPAIAYDFFPTLLRAAGGALPQDRVYDGCDITPLLTGKASTVGRENPFYWAYTDHITAVREGNWKLHVYQRGKRLDEPELYDLSCDPGETTPVNGEHPEVLRRLLTFVREEEADIPKAWSLVYPVRDPEKRKSGVRRE